VSAWGEWTWSDRLRRVATWQALGVSITPPGPGQSMWVARDPARGVILAAERWLGTLLDTLDQLEGSGGPDRC
jgi:hypothetical protein